MDTTAVAVHELEAGEPIPTLSNDALIITLIQTLNHLSRWLTPVHDRSVLQHAPRRAEPSVKDLLMRMRDTEARVYAYMYAIANQNNPDLDRVPEPRPDPRQQAADRLADPLVTMSEFRRVRESTTSLLRALPDNAWARDGFSRTKRNWTIRELAEYLATHDRAVLREIDQTLVRVGAREGIAAVSQVSYELIHKPFATVLTRD
jgi:hypothetical protein